MKRKKEKGAEKIRRETAVFEFGGEVTLVRSGGSDTSNQRRHRSVSVFIKLNHKNKR